MIRKEPFLILCMMLIVLFCQGKERKGTVMRYDIRLDSVACDRECGFVQEMQEATFRDLDGVPYARCRYADDIIDMSWSVSDKAFNYSIINKTDSILILWINDIFAHDWSGKPSSFGYSMEKSPYPARMIVPAKTFSSGYLIPMDSYPDKLKYETELKPVLPIGSGSILVKRRRAAKNIGKKYEIVLPIHIGHELYTYHLTFVVAGTLAAGEADETSIDTCEADTLHGEDIACESTSVLQFSNVPTPPSSIAGSEKLLTSPPLPTYQTLLKSGINADDPLLKLTSYAVRSDFFNQSCPQEKVYLHLDNTAYFQGETIWFAATVVNATNLGEAASKVLYVELLSPTGVVLKQQKLKVIGGRCHGSFPLIDNSVQEAVEKRGAIGYPSGYYQIRAYTRTMLNFDDAGIYSRVIPVYKAPDEEGDYADPVMRKYNGNETYRPQTTRADKPEKLNISFYPEGGHLVEGLPCRVAFKATDEHGHGVELVSMTDDSGQTINLGPQHLGMGSFMLPISNNYSFPRYVKASSGGRSCSVKLPAAEPSGCALMLHDNSQGTLEVSINACGLDQDSLFAYTITHQGEICAFDTLHMSCVTSSEMVPAICSRRFSVSSDRLPTGVCQFTLFNAAGAVLAQRLFFANNALPVASISVATDKDSYHPFEEINLHFSDAPSCQHFSLSVRDAADYGTAYQDDIYTYMLLSSELKGLIEKPAWYFGNAPEAERVAALDLLMMVQGWTRYDWRKMAGVEPFTVQHFTEDRLVVDGWAFSRILEKPLANTQVSVDLTSPDGLQKQKATVTTDSLGYWSVALDDFDGVWSLFMKTRQEGWANEGRTTRMRLERSSRPPLRAYTPLEMWLPNYIWNVDSMLSVSEAKDPQYTLPSDAHLLNEVVINGRRKYIDYYTFHAFDAAADAELIFDEGKYTGKVEDYLHEKGYDIQYAEGDVGDQDYSKDKDPLFAYVRALICAAPINNRRTFWYVHEGNKHYISPANIAGYDIDLEDVKSIIVYDSPSIYTSYPPLLDILGADGIAAIMKQDRSYFSTGLNIVDIELNPEDKRKTFVDKNSRQTTFAGYSTPVEFYAPTYPNGPVQGDKDYRRTIYWNPEVTTDSTGCANVSFYNNGYSRSLTVSAEGLTKDGKAIINK